MAAPEQPAREPGHDDPSMDDILASIRRILNEDEAPSADDDVLRLEPSMMVPDQPEPPEPVHPPVAHPHPAEPPHAAAATPSGPLVAPAAAAAASSAVGELLRRLAAERATQVSRNGPTVEDLVRQEIRPMLQGWLDTHLPPLVERLVRQEIERVVNRSTNEG